MVVSRPGSLNHCEQTKRKGIKMLTEKMRDEIMEHVLFKIKVLVKEGDDIKLFNEMSNLLKPVNTKDLNEFIIKRD